MLISRIEAASQCSKKRVQSSGPGVTGIAASFLSVSHVPALGNRRDCHYFPRLPQKGIDLEYAKAATTVSGSWQTLNTF